MKNKVLILLWILLLLIASHQTLAMRIEEGTLARITINEERNLYGYEDSFAVSANKVVWIDYRDPLRIPQLFGVCLDDPNLTEFLIDANAEGTSTIACSNPWVVYTITEQDPYQLLLKIADIQHPSSPVLYTFSPWFNDVYNIDISGNLIVYDGPDSENDYRYTVLAVDISQPNNPQHYLIDIAPASNVISSLALDGSFAVWNEISFEDGSSVVKIADLTNPALPQIVSIQLPPGITFDDIQASENNLIAQGYQNWQTCLYAVKNYRQTSQWTIQTVWKEAGSEEFWTSGPKIDGPIALWVTTTQMPAAADGAPLQGESLYRLKAAYLLENSASISTLLTTSDPSQFFSADIDDMQIVWSMGNWEEADLYKGSLVLECGDWGYKPGDINRDCLVNLEDFATLAQDWLACTVPDQEGCEYGF